MCGSNPFKKVEDSFKKLAYKIGGGSMAADAVVNMGSEAMANLQKKLAIENAISNINNVFNSDATKKMYGDKRDAITTINTNSVNDQYKNTERSLRESLAARGMGGGSADIDGQSALTKAANAGRMQAAEMGKSAYSDMINQDNALKNDLLMKARAGLDATQASDMAIQQRDSVANRYNNQANQSAIGDLFSNIANSYIGSQRQEGINNGMRYNPYGYSRSSANDFGIIRKY